VIFDLTSSEAYDADANLSLTTHGMMHLLLRFVQDFGVNPVKLGRDLVKILPRKFAGVGNKIQLFGPINPR